MKVLTLILLVLLSLVGYGQSITRARFDSLFIRADETFNGSTIKSGGLSLTGVTTTIKATISKGKFTIYLDEFKVTDSIFIVASNKKVGISVYKFLDYFLIDPIDLGIKNDYNINTPHKLDGLLR